MITRLKEKPSTRRKTRDLAEREYEYVLLAISNNPNDTSSVIEAWPGVPRIGSPYIEGTIIDSGAQCRHIEVQKADPWIQGSGQVGYVWEILCRFSTRLEEGGGNKPKPADPFRWPTEISWRSKRIEVFTDFDATGKTPLVNSAGDPFKKPPGIGVYHAIVTLSRYEAVYNPVRAMQFAGKVNSTTWFACPPYTALCEFPEATLTLVENRYLWKISYSFEIAEERWLPYEHPYNQSYILDHGMRAFTDRIAEIKNKPVPVRDALDNLMSEPAWLDGRGYQKELADLPGGRPVKLDFQFYKTIDFNQLRLP